MPQVAALLRQEERQQADTHALSDQFGHREDAVDPVLEFFYLDKFADIEDLKAGLRRYIHYYNHQRIKLKLNGLSPVQYRIQALGC